MPCMLSCLRANVANVLKCSRPNMFCVPTFSRAISSYNKIKFLMTCFTYIFNTFSLSFSSEMKLYMKSARQAGISRETFVLRI